MTMADYVIEQLDVSEYEKCGNIWNMDSDPHTEPFRKEMESGNRVVFIYKMNGEFIGEIAYVLEMNDHDYTIPNRRIYLSRLIVKQEYRNRGIGGILIDFMVDIIGKMGYKEISIGVDKDNAAALHLYQKKGFSTVIFSGVDENGEYYKLMKSL